jgi:hypothetical protein
MAVQAVVALVIGTVLVLLVPALDGSRSLPVCVRLCGTRCGKA